MRATLLVALLAATGACACKKKKADDLAPSKEALEMYRDLKKSAKGKKRPKQPSDYVRDLKPQNAHTSPNSQ